MAYKISTAIDLMEQNPFVAKEWGNPLFKDVEMGRFTSRGLIVGSFSQEFTARYIQGYVAQERERQESHGIILIDQEGIFPSENQILIYGTCGSGKSSMMRRILASQVISAEKELRVGDSIYPLKKPIMEIELEGLCTKLLVPPEEQKNSEVFKRALHLNFQRIWRTAPHERSGEDREIWSLLLEYIDYDAYLRKNPLPETKVGKLVSRDLNRVVISWFGDEDEGNYDSLDLPPEIITAEIGSTVTLTLKKLEDGRIKWIDCLVSPVLLTDEEALREYGDKIRYLDDLPTGKWPRKTDERE